MNSFPLAHLMLEHLFLLVCCGKKSWLKDELFSTWPAFARNSEIFVELYSPFLVVRINVLFISSEWGTSQREILVLFKSAMKMWHAMARNTVLFTTVFNS